MVSLLAPFLILNQANPNPIALLAPSQLAVEAQILQDAIETIHPGARRFLSKKDLQSKGRELRKEAEFAGDTATWYRAVSRYLASLRCDHTKAEWPETVQDFRRENPTHLPFRFTLWKGKALVTAVPSGSSIKVGDRLLEVEGRRIADLQRAISPLTAVDGHTDFAKDLKFGDDPDLLGSELDTFGPVLWGLRTKFKLKFEKAGTVSLTGISFNEFTALRPHPDFRDAVDAKELPGRTQYLKITSFINYRDRRDPIEAFRPIFANMQRSGAQRLILDLRNCGGGSDEVPIALLRFLCPAPPVWAKEIWQTRLSPSASLLPLLNSYDPALQQPNPANFLTRPDGSLQLKLIADPETLVAPKPLPEVFTGPVDVLVGPTNVSAATIFLTRLRMSRKVRLIGQPTGGSAAGPNGGTFWFMTLPSSKITIRIPVRRVETGWPGRRDQGQRPDILKSPTQDDVLGTTDSVLAWSLANPATLRTPAPVGRGAR